MNNRKDWLRYSIFLSSTFDDLDGERDYIKNVILPSVNKYLQSYYIHVDLCDLRQGIDAEGMSEREKNKFVLSKCFRQIEECSPLFIGLVGNRYGWKPDYDDLVCIGPILNKWGLSPSSVLGKSVTEIEMMVGDFLCDNKYSIFCIRESNFISEEVEIEKLRSFILDKYSETNNNKVLSYSVDNLAESKLDKYKDFETKLTQLLIKKIRSLAGGRTKENDITKLSLESFIYKKTHKFLKPHLDKKYKELLNNHKHLVLWGYEGYGKSAYLSNYYNELISIKNNRQLILYYSFDVPEISNDFVDMIKYWMAMIDPIFLKCYDGYYEPELFVMAFGVLLNDAYCKNKDCVIIIDSYDKASYYKNPYYNSLKWVPEYVTLLVSTGVEWAHENQTLNHGTYCYLPLSYIEEKKFIKSLGYIDMTDDVIESILKINFIEENKILALPQNSPLFNKLIVEHINDFTEKNYKEFRKAIDYNKAIREFRLSNIPKHLITVESAFLMLISNNADIENIRIVLDLLSIAKTGFSEEHLKTFTKALNLEWNSDIFDVFCNKYAEYIGYSVFTKKWFFNYELCKNALIEQMDGDYLSSLYNLVVTCLFQGDKLNYVKNGIVNEMFFYLVRAFETEPASILLNNSAKVPRSIIDSAKSEIYSGLLSESCRKLYSEWLQMLFIKTSCPNAVIDFILSICDMCYLTGSTTVILGVLNKLCTLSQVFGYDKLDSGIFQNYLRMLIFLSESLTMEDLLDEAERYIAKMQECLITISNSSHYSDLRSNLEEKISTLSAIVNTKRSKYPNYCVDDNSDVEIELRSYAEEINDITSLVHMNPDSIKYVFDLVKLYSKHIKWLLQDDTCQEEAIELVQKMGEMVANAMQVCKNGEIMHNMAGVCFHLSDYLLKREFDKSACFLFYITYLIDKTLNDKRPSAENAQNLSMIYYKLSICYSKLKMHEELLNLVEEWKSNDSANSLLDKFNLYNHWGEMFYNAGMIDKALKYYTEICDVLYDELHKGRQEYAYIYCEFLMKRSLCITKFNINEGLVELNKLLDFMQLYISMLDDRDKLYGNNSLSNGEIKLRENLLKLSNNVRDEITKYTENLN